MTSFDTFIAYAFTFSLGLALGGPSRDTGTVSGIFGVFLTAVIGLTRMFTLA